jgi:acyl-CoA reductase-like NAD-dependent aldehyde dehydrogenase
MPAQRHRVTEHSLIHRPVNPATGEPLPVRILHDATQIADLLATARAAATMWAGTPVSARTAALTRLAHLLCTQADALARTLTREQGKPLADAVSELTKAAQVLDHFADPAMVTAADETRTTETGTSQVTYEAAGVVAAIVPNNYPITLLAYKLAPALAAGCAVVAKPDPQTGGVTDQIAALAIEAGIPPGVVQVAHADPATAATALVVADEVDVVAFTGSRPAGHQVRQATARAASPTSCLLELGGANSMVVEADAPLAETVSAAVYKAFHNSGQVCHGVSSVFVARQRFREWLECFWQRAGRLRLGDGLDPETELGPLATRAGRDRVAEQIHRARTVGATVLSADPGPADGWFHPVTVLTGLDADSPLLEDELFGPAVVVLPYRRIGDVIAALNGRSGGLAAYLYGEDTRRLSRYAAELRYGTVGINTHRVVTPHAPFGGWRDSGLGHELGPDAVRAYQRPRHIRSVT